MNRGKVIFFSALGLLVVGGGIFVYVKYFKKPLDQTGGEAIPADVTKPTTTGKSTATKSVATQLASMPSSPIVKKSTGAIGMGSNIKAKAALVRLLEVGTGKELKQAEKGQYLGVVNGISSDGKFYKFMDEKGNQFMVLTTLVEKS